MEGTEITSLVQESFRTIHGQALFQYFTTRTENAPLLSEDGLSFASCPFACTLISARVGERRNRMGQVNFSFENFKDRVIPRTDVYLYVAIFGRRQRDVHYLDSLTLGLTKWSRNLTDESSIQIMNVLLTPSNDSNLPLKTPIFLFIKYLYVYNI